MSCSRSPASYPEKRAIFGSRKLPPRSDFSVGPRLSERRLGLNIRPHQLIYELNARGVRFPPFVEFAVHPKTEK